MKKDKKIALIIMFIVGLILIMVAIEYDNNTTAEKIRNEREKIEARLEAVKAKDSIENKKE
jgi:putative Mn2+ efflux pump MntP